MQLALFNGNIYIKTSKEEYPIVKGLPNVKFDKSKLAWVTPATLEMLDRLQRIVKLPETLEAERQRMRTVQNKVDHERLNEHPEPMYNYPVKVKLFTHQIRGANMCMHLFGWDEETEGATTQ